MKMNENIPEKVWKLYAKLLTILFFQFKQITDFQKLMISVLNVPQAAINSKSGLLEFQCHCEPFDLDSSMKKQCR